ncbi:hypothetical protein BC936DRAFT_146458 [Jimgerdemannia flammicorona]|uniref:Myb-like domain-containing protein n=1 Tax=Jimgerdemannia flammicorona TaxID=994334 RepID=A0A433D7N6_9FUNG|nr:hypothetical protein BC936DRAFT_146458 [Jimgerdemannia flammicorona]
MSATGGPAGKSRPWETEEDAKLLRVIFSLSNQKIDWPMVACEMGNDRTKLACERRFQRIVGKTNGRGNGEGAPRNKGRASSAAKVKIEKPKTKVKTEKPDVKIKIVKPKTKVKTEKPDVKIKTETPNVQASIEEEVDELEDD